jgi:hypothetical protein
MTKRYACVLTLAAGVLFAVSQVGCTTQGGKKVVKPVAQPKPAVTKPVEAKPVAVKEAPKNKQLLDQEVRKLQADMALREAAVRRDGGDVVVARTAYDEAKKNWPENLRKQVKAAQDGEARLQDLDAKKKAADELAKKAEDVRKGLDSDAELAELKKKADEVKAASYAASKAYAAKRLEKETASKELTEAKKAADEAKKALADAEKTAYEPALKQVVDKDPDMQKMRTRIAEIEKEQAGGAAGTTAVEAKPVEKIEVKAVEKVETKPAEKPGHN